MRLELTTDTVIKMTLDKFPELGVPYKAWRPAPGLNYLVYDSHRDAPVGFAIRVGKKASVYLVEKHVAGKNMKIPVGLARGKKGDEPIMELSAARNYARDLIATAKKHGANPKTIADQVEASELTLGQVWDRYVSDLLGRSQPIKPNSKLSLDKARDKLKDWEDRKVRLITGEEILKRFDLHAVERGHRTAAEAMGRWATSAVANAIENEVHNAHAEGRPPSLAYNPFTILKTKKKYRAGIQLERDYAAKGIRNPLSFSTSVGPFVKTAWAYRSENPVAGDFMLLDLIWGMRGDECRTFKWRDRIDDAEAVTARWIDLNKRVARVNDAKNRGDHEFPIGPCAIELLKLRRAAELEGQAWVFPARSANSTKGHYSDPSVALNTVRERAGIKTVRGHDLRRTFGAACEKLGFTDRQAKRMLGHGVASGETMGRYTSPEWGDIAERMRRVEELVLAAAPSVYNALRPKSAARISDVEDVSIGRGERRASKRKPR
jgi:integrase